MPRLSEQELAWLDDYRLRALGELARIREHDRFVTRYGGTAPDLATDALGQVVERDVPAVVAAYREALAALAPFVDDYPCVLDHEGYCQAHGMSKPCRMVAAREALGLPPPVVTEGPPAPDYPVGEYQAYTTPLKASMRSGAALGLPAAPEPERGA